MVVENISVQIIKGDITECKVDAIVNAANDKLIMGSGLSGMIKKKGGEGIEKEALKKGPIKIGDAVHTKAGKLSSKYVIHAAAMGMGHKTDEAKIRNSCKNALKIAKRLKIRSIALPALGCGAGEFPIVACAKIIAQETFRFSIEGNKHLRKIILCLYDENTYAIFKRTVNSYLKFIQDKLQRGPFSTVDIIIENQAGIVIIKRSNPPFGWALPGGFVDYNESLETAAMREAKEETGLDIYDLVQFHTYSQPNRDPRFHTINTVFTAKAKGRPKAATDAVDSKIIKVSQIEKVDFAFDHKQILKDYLKTKKR